MQRQARLALATALLLGSSGALAQDGALAGVTMRVLDDLRDVDAVVLELDANRGTEAEDGERATADGEQRRTDGEAQRGERSRDAAARDTAATEERRERTRLHDVDADERAEGRLEDRDLERSTQPPPPAPAP
jgi:hypothetical protein